MNETWLHIGPHLSAARLSIRQVSASRGIGMVQLRFAVEATAKHAGVEGFPLIFNGRLEALGVGGSDTACPLAALLPLNHAPVLRGIGSDVFFTLVADVDDRQLHIMEEHRNGAQRFRICLSGMTVYEGRYERFWGDDIDYTVSQGDWIAILEQVGYAKRFLVELEVPSPQSNPDLVEAISYFMEAHRRYMQGEWRGCVESLRQSVAAIVGKKPDDEDEASDVQAALRNARSSMKKVPTRYDVRIELIRQALKFYCDLGAHPEAAETRRRDAHAALVMTSGLLKEFSES